MKSKKEIIHGITGVIPKFQDETVFPLTHVTAAMDTHAQQDSICFAEWAIKNYWVAAQFPDGNILWHTIVDSLKGLKPNVTTSDLYKLYKKEVGDE